MAHLVLCDQVSLHPGQPLWQRVPVRDENGKPLNDFMMLIPSIRRWPRARRELALAAIQQVFSEFGEQVVFADLNLKLSLLWVSIRPGGSGCIGLAAAIKQRVPEAVLVASQAEAMAGHRVADRRRWSWLTKRLR